ncbi:MAG: UPF0182 family protein [Gemmatimonadales bacterium]|nr:UPF0182 family protein [Gemmatimonadales bacterium]
MNRRGRRLIAAIAGVVTLLFVGRWAAGLLADRWWAAQISPAAVDFLTDWHVLRVTLDLAGFLLASAWFIGHLFIVYRAVGSVQIRRNVANLEFREALTPGVLLAVAVGCGALLGLLVGTGGATRWQAVALAWQGVSYGLTDPLLRHDAGLYLAQLPAWRLAHGFALLLVVFALGVVFGLYALVGAVRWLEGRPAINDHARAHLGWLLTALALSLVWGYVLEPYEMVAGLEGPVDLSAWNATTLVSPLLVGVGLATAGLSAAWALRPRHALAAAGWIVLSLASLIGHWLVPPAMGGEGESPATAATAIDRLNRMAYGLEALVEGQYSPTGPPAPPKVVSLWNAEMIGHVAAADSNEVLAIDPAILQVRGTPRPVWLAVRAAPNGRTSVTVIADDRVGAAGQPLFYSAGDTLPRPDRGEYLELGADALRPNAPPYRIETADRRGVQLGGWARRLMIAWALQAGRLLRELPPQTRVDWRLSPAERLKSLAPFARWGEPVPRIINRGLVWVVDGYLAPRTFPLSARLHWRRREIGAFEAGFLATVDASTGATRIYLRPRVTGLAAAWAVASGGLVEPASAIPEAVHQAAPYPLELFRIQASYLEQQDPRPGSLGGAPGSRAAELPATDLGWSADSAGPVRVAVYERANERRLGALLSGTVTGGAQQLRMFRFDSATALQSRTALENRWSHFATYDALGDSIREDGGKLESGPIRLNLSRGGPVAYQSHFARGPRDAVFLAWVSLAGTGDRLGAGRSVGEAWNNMLGTSVPAIAGSAQATRLDEARRWVERADSALRLGDWTAFGQAWRSLRGALGLPAGALER